MPTQEKRRRPQVNRYITGVDGNHPRLRFPAKARRYSDAQYAILIKSPMLTTVMLGKYDLVHCNFGLAEVANNNVGRFVEIVRYSDLTEADIKMFVVQMRKAAIRNSWPDEMLDIELQFLARYC